MSSIIPSATTANTSTTSPTPAELAALRVAQAAAATPDGSYDLVSSIVFALGRAGVLQTPETAADADRLRARIAELTELLEQAQAEARTARGSDEYAPALPWAALLDEEDLHDFLGDLVAAAVNRWRWDPEVPDAETLRQIEAACMTWRLIAEAQHAHNTAAGSDVVEGGER